MTKQEVLTKFYKGDEGGVRIESKKLSNDFIFSYCPVEHEHHNWNINFSDKCACGQINPDYEKEKDPLLKKSVPNLKRYVSV